MTNILSTKLWVKNLKGLKYYGARACFSVHSGIQRELRRPENKQLDGQTFLTGAAWNKIRLNAKQNLTGFHASLLHPVPRVRLKPPLPMNTNLHTCGDEANRTMPGVKQRPQVMFLGPKKASEAISEHPTSKNFSGGAYPQTPLA